MELSKQEREILDGEKGRVWQKIMDSIYRYGEFFEAKKLIPLENKGHMVLSAGALIFTPYFKMLDEVIAEGIKCKYPFSADPRPIDNDNVKSNILQRIVAKVAFMFQKRLESQYRQLGIQDEYSYSCACYLPQNDNIPKKGEIIAWAESSAVVFANSIIGARTNRNSSGIEILMNLLGKTPLFGLLTDEGRKATWKIEVKCRSKPNAQILGSAIGLKVNNEVPFIIGLDKFFDNQLNEEAIDFLKDMGAAAASNGAVGLYHVENITPEAKEMGNTLLVKNYQTYIIDEKELDRIYNSYPVIWRRNYKKPKKCFIGCPHLSLNQLREWSEKIWNAVGVEGVKTEVVLLSGKKVLDEFKKDKISYERLMKTGVKLSCICPFTFMSNPFWNKKPIVTNSNKLRTYTSCRFFRDDKILEIIKTGLIHEE